MMMHDTLEKVTIHKQTFKTITVQTTWTVSKYEHNRNLKEFMCVDS